MTTNCTFSTAGLSVGPVRRPAVLDDTSSITSDHNPGLPRDTIERGVGVVVGASRVPLSILSGAAVGAVQGVKRARNSQPHTRSRSVELALNAGKFAQQTALSTLLSFAVSGPVGAAVTLTRGLLVKGAMLEVKRQKSTAGEVANQVAKAIDREVKPGDATVSALVRGAATGVKTAVRAGADNGYQDGRGAVSGLLESAPEVALELSNLASPTGSLPKKVFKAVTGAFRAVVSAPAAVVEGALVNEKGNKLSPRVRQVLSTATGAALGATVGLVAGPVGAIVGASLGAAVGSTSRTKNQQFSDQIANSIERAAHNDRNLGTEETNRVRNQVQGAVVGLSAGVRYEWNSAVTG